MVTARGIRFQMTTIKSKSSLCEYLEHTFERIMYEHAFTSLSPWSKLTVFGYEISAVDLIIYYHIVSESSDQNEFNLELIREIVWQIQHF